MSLTCKFRPSLRAAAFWAACALATAQGAAAAGQIPVAVGVKVEAAGDSTHLVLDLTRAASAEAFVLSDPDRVVIDLPEVYFQLGPAEAEPAASRRGKTRREAAGAAEPQGAGLIRAYRYGLLGPGRSRLVIDLAAPALVTRLYSASVSGGDPTRLTLELSRTDRTSFLAAVKAHAPQEPAPPPSPAPANPNKLVIVLDPGHGGIDSGAAVGAEAVEKAIVFEFAKAMARRLEAEGRYSVVLTRAGDTFVSLADRVRIAREHHADLFVSLHADSLAQSGEVQGATFYTASDKASDQEAARLAESENRADLIAGLDSAEEASGVTDILADLTRRETRAYSHLFARTLAGVWQNASRLNKNPQRSAGFKVLKAPDVPSVLIELGYLSSAKDVANLTSEAWREKAAAAATQAVGQFFDGRIPAAATVAQTLH